MPSRALLLVGLDTPVATTRERFIAEGFEAHCAETPVDARAMLAMHPYDALLTFATAPTPVRHLLDAIKLPRSSSAGVVLCVGTIGADDEVALLRAGAAACLPAQIAFDELLARTRALLRRANGYPRHHRIGDLGVDPVSRRASRSGVPLRLRPTEFDILLCLAEGHDELVLKDELLRRLWPRGNGSSNLLAVHMSNLRAAIDNDGASPLLHTVRNIGYVLSDAHPRAAAVATAIRAQ